MPGCAAVEYRALCVVGAHRAANRDADLARSRGGHGMNAMTTTAADLPAPARLPPLPAPPAAAPGAAARSLLAPARRLDRTKCQYRVARTRARPCRHFRRDVRAG